MRRSGSVPMDMAGMGSNNNSPSASVTSTGSINSPHNSAQAARLARKAELARASRKRKKAYVSELEDRIKKLTAAIERLQAKRQYDIEETAGSGHGSYSNIPESSASRMDVDDADDGASVSSVSELNNNYRSMALEDMPMNTNNSGGNNDNNGNMNESETAEQKLMRRLLGSENEKADRHRRTEYLIDRVIECVEPGAQAKFLMWMLAREDSFYEGKGLWSAMQDAVGVPMRVADELHRRRVGLRADSQHLAHTTGLLEQLRTDAQAFNAELSDLLVEVRTVLSPPQMIRFHKWLKTMS